jgi:hypothetical protein
MQHPGKVEWIPAAHFCCLYDSHAFAMKGILHAQQLQKPITATIAQLYDIQHPWSAIHLPGPCRWHSIATADAPGRITRPVGLTGGTCKSRPPKPKPCDARTWQWLPGGRMGSRMELSDRVGTHGPLAGAWLSPGPWPREPVGWCTDCTIQYMYPPVPADLR